MGIVQRVFAPLDKIPKDKLLHYVTGQVIALVVLAFPNLLVGAAFAAAVFIGKEIHDYYTPGHKAEWNDVWASVLGGVPVYIAFLMGRAL